MNNIGTMEFYMVLYNLLLPLGERVHQRGAACPAVLCRRPERPDGRVPGAGAEEGRGAEDPPGPQGGSGHHRRHLHLHHHHPHASARRHLVDGWPQVRPKGSCLLNCLTASLSICTGLIPVSLQVPTGQSHRSQEDVFRPASSSSRGPATSKPPGAPRAL